MQTVSAENRFFKNEFGKTILSRDRVQKYTFWGHFMQFRRCFIYVLQLTVKQVRVCKNYVFGRKILSFNLEIPVIFDDRTTKTIIIMQTFGGKETRGTTSIKMLPKPFVLQHLR